VEASKKDNVFPIYLVTSKSQHKLAMTFVRFQEHFESPEFAGKVFTLEEFADWYASQHDDFFSYSDDWGGFNVPSWVVDKFRAGLFDPLSQKEKHFLDLTNVTGRAYFIGMSTAKGIKIGTLRHEVVHGLQYVGPRDFNNVVNGYVVSSWKDSVFSKDWEKLFKKLRAMGYDNNVLVDEAIAYLTTGLAGELNGLSIKFVKITRDKLRAHFKEHFGFSIHRADAVDILNRIHIINLDSAA